LVIAPDCLLKTTLKPEPWVPVMLKVVSVSSMIKFMAEEEEEQQREVVTSDNCLRKELMIGKICGLEGAGRAFLVGIGG
jgi:hypothetical protein